MAEIQTFLEAGVAHKNHECDDEAGVCTHRFDYQCVDCGAIVVSTGEDWVSEPPPAARCQKCLSIYDDDPDAPDQQIEACDCPAPFADAHDCALTALEQAGDTVFDDHLVTDWYERHSNARCECYCHQEPLEITDETDFEWSLRG